MEKIIRSRVGQGTTEYIVILALVVALAVGIFWKPVKEALTGQVGKITSGINTAGTQ